MVKVELYLYDEQEMAWFAQFNAAVLQYRRANQQKQEPGPGQRVPDEVLVGDPAAPGPVVPEEPSDPPVQDESIVGSIKPAAPSLADLVSAIQAALTGPMAGQVKQVQDLLAKYGAKVVAEVPAEKRAELMLELAK